MPEENQSTDDKAKRIERLEQYLFNQQETNGKIVGSIENLEKLTEQNCNDLSKACGHLKEIEHQAKITNGRVTTIETEKIPNLEQKWTNFEDRKKSENSEQQKTDSAQDQKINDVENKVGKLAEQRENLISLDGKLNSLLRWKWKIVGGIAVFTFLLYYDFIQIPKDLF